MMYPKTEYIYNVCIGSFAKSGDYAKVATLLQEMEQKKLTLQRNTSITLSSLLLKAGKVELAQAVLNWKAQPGGVNTAAIAAQADDEVAAANAVPAEETAEEDIIAEQLKSQTS